MTTDQEAAEKYAHLYGDSHIGIACDAFKAGASHGRKAERARCEAILTDELHDLELAEFGERHKERTNIRAWLRDARARIRPSEKES